MTIELKTYEATAAEIFTDIFRRCEYSNEVREFIEVLMPDTDSTFSTRHFCGDPYTEMVDELFA